MNPHVDLQSEYNIEPQDLLEAQADQAGERLDVFCARAFGLSRSQAQRAISMGCARINQLAALKPGEKLRLGDAVSFIALPPEEIEARPEDIPLSIVYEDADIALIDKPQGMVVHPAPGNPDGTLVNALLHHLADLSGIGGAMRPGIVHRLDKMTSGLIMVAKNDLAHNSLCAQLKAHMASRVYLAIVEGNIREESGTVDAAIARSKIDRKRMAIDPDGREARTHWRVLERYGPFTLVECRLETGRTHQIRVHMAALKHPVAGDAVYGPSKPKLALAGQALHAARLTLKHPRTGAQMTFKAPVPAYFRAALLRAGRQAEPDIEELLQRIWEG